MRDDDQEEVRAASVTSEVRSTSSSCITSPSSVSPSTVSAPNPTPPEDPSLAFAKAATTVSSVPVSVLMGEKEEGVCEKEEE